MDGVCFCFLLHRFYDNSGGILKDYNSLPIKESLKTYYSVESGKFVKNEELEITSDMREYFKALVLQLKKE